MRILFECRNCGLGNNGGTSTIIKSANALVNLGHEVTLIDDQKNQHTWTPLIAKHLIPKTIDEVPAAEVIIGTGYNTVQPMLELPERCGAKSHWIRAWETWQMTEEQILRKVLNPPTIKIVNSSELQTKLEEFGTKSHIIRPGNDLDKIKPNIKRNGNKVIILGGLYNIRHKTKRTSWILESAKYLKKLYGKRIKLWMFGVNSDPNIELIDKYFSQPTLEDKNYFYNSVTIMLSPSNLEGLHIVPQEAMLAECPVVTTDTLLGGTKDYIINGESGVVTDNVLIDFQNGIKELIQDSKLRNKLGKAGREKIISLGSREENMMKMVKLFQKNS